MLLQLLVELQGDANHHFSFIPIGVGDVVQDAIKICGRDKQVMNEQQHMNYYVTDIKYKSKCIILIHNLDSRHNHELISVELTLGI